MGFEQLATRLAERRVEYVIIGGFAAVVHGAAVVTRDVDVCIRLSKENLFALRDALADLHPKHRITPQRLPFELTEADWPRIKNLYLETDWGVIDCLGEVLGIGGYDEVLGWAEELGTPLGKLKVLTLDGLIRAKEAVGRPHDLQTVSQLKAIKAQRERPKG